MSQPRYFHDPKEDLTAIAMTQFTPCFGPEVSGMRAALRSLASQAVVD